MTRLQIELPDDLKARLQARAAEEGFATIEQYAAAILVASADDELLDPGTEQVLLQRLDDPSPGVEFDDTFRRQFLEEVQRRRQTRENRP